MDKFYRILELEPNVSDNEVKKQYKKLALKYHPDRNTEDTSEKFKEISDAYQNIINKKVNIRQVNPQDIFTHFMKQQMQTRLYQQMNIVREASNFSNILPSQMEFTSSSVQIINGKRIEKITEKKGGVTRTRTIITDI
tara:strand:+ start:137 stop:550 length:414 start_codon:yes stop_codon:yes gene_type:complete